MTPEQAKEYFPTQISKGRTIPTLLKYLLMAPPKWGKTTFFSSIPDALLLAFEEGHMFVDCYKVIITDWDHALRKNRAAYLDNITGIKYCTAMEILEALEAIQPCPFRFVIIDTLDVATKMASTFECTKAGIKSPNEGGQYGVGWDLYQTRPVRLFYNRLVKLGIGVAALTHVKEGIDEQTGRFVRETSLPGGVQRFVHNQSDLIMNGLWPKHRTGHMRDRIISFDATNEVIAGTRVRGVYVPIEYRVDPPSDANPGAPWSQWESFFTNSPAAGEAAERDYIQFQGQQGQLKPKSKST